MNARDLFIDPSNPTSQHIETFREGVRVHNEALEKDPLHGAEQLFAVDFLAFVDQATSHMKKPEKHGQGPASKMHPTDVLIGYDPKAEPERFLLDAWDKQAPFWPLIETPSSYVGTMATILKFIRGPETGTFKLLSLGCGAGLYETYLGLTFQKAKIPALITCMDFSPEMGKQQRAMLSRFTPRPMNIKIRTGDMTNIPFPDKSMDGVLCNNSLQWCVNWKKAIKEMARVLNPDRTPNLYLFVHLHAQGMAIRDESGTPIVQLPAVGPDELMDELETNGFDIHFTRQIMGDKGTGQYGGNIDRLFLFARHEKDGVRQSWRTKTVKPKGATVMRG